VESDELAAWLRLSLTPGVGNNAARKLLSAFGLPAHIFEQSLNALRQVVGQAQAQALLETPAEFADQLESAKRWLETGKDGVDRRILPLGDDQYPPCLLRIEDPPLLLYLMGNGVLHRPDVCSAESVSQPRLQRAIAIVGSRNPTPQGESNARQFSKSLADAGLTVVSGLALGIDGAAHGGALEATSPQRAELATIAVVGTGLDRVYPKQHLALARKICEHGLMLSEYPIGTPPLAANFPKRNRLIAALSEGVLVVEAALRSGSLITANQSIEQGKDVFAIPGSIHSPQSRGCHALIKQGAKLVESAQDVLEELHVNAHPPTAPQRDTSFADAGMPDSGAQSLLRHIGFDPVGLDALVARSGIEAAHWQAQLLEFELAGEVARLPGGLYQRIGRA
jgi:DNA processing protein